jgi:putative flippase GtrA
MAGASTKISNTAWRLAPGPLRRKLETEAGKRFLRFVPVAVAAVASSQIALAVLVGLVRMTAGTAAFIASAIGALVSYILTRWAWESKGRPDLLRETLPFWVIAVAAWIFLSFCSHEASVWSRHMGHSHWERTAVVMGAYLIANCITFVIRFLIFHYVLFASRGDKAKAVQVLSPSQQLAEAQDPTAAPGGSPEQAGEPGQDGPPAPLELAAERRAEQPARR